MQRTAPRPGLGSVVRCGVPDDDGSGEPDGAAEHEPAWEAFAEQQPAEDGHEHRADVHEHRCGARVDHPLRLVEDEVVDAEPEQPAHEQPGQVAAPGQRLPAHQREDPERDAANRQPSQRQRARRQRASCGANTDERRRPEHHRCQRRRERQSTLALRDHRDGWVGNHVCEAYPANSSAVTELSGLYGCGMGTDFAAVGRLLSSPARAAMLEVLLDGGTASASELAAAASVKASTASGHLAALVEGRMLVVTARGRHRDYRLADRDVAVALETLSRIAPDRQIHSLRAATTMDVLRVARTCYDHLAGQLGVAMLDAMLEREWLVTRGPGYLVPETGERMLQAMGVDVADARRQHRHFARPCVDWTERRPHLAGALGAAICRSVLAAGWARRRRTGRGLVVTTLGAAQLHETFGIALAAGA